MEQELGEKGKRSRQRLLAFAAEEFAEQGYYKTKVGTIVARAGLTQPAFYLYFQSKEDIFKELVSDFRTHFQDLIKKSQLEKGIHPQDLTSKISGVMEMIFQFLMSDPHLTRIGFFLAPEAEEIKQDIALLIKENLLVEQKVGYFSPDQDMTIVAEVLIGAIERLTVTKLLPGTNNPKDLAKQVVHLILHGISSE